MGVEHNLAKVGVASSNLVSRSSFVLLRLRLTGQEMGGMSGRHLKCRDFNSAFSSKVFSLGLYCSGAIAKRLCTGLQIHVGRFDSGSRLHLFGDPHSPKLRQDAPVVKLVDTRDLKSLGLWLCRFDSGPGHHLYLSLYLLQYSLFSLSFFKLRHQQKKK